MMKLSIMLFFFIIATSFQCKKSEEDCHFEISFQNNSEMPVYWGILSNGIYGCRFEGEKLNKNESGKYRPFNFCIEDGMSDSDVFEFYVIDTALVNPPDVYFSCDSVEYYNKVLRKYELSLQDLKESGFTIYYP